MKSYEELSEIETKLKKLEERVKKLEKNFRNLEETVQYIVKWVRINSMMILLLALGSIIFGWWIE